MEIRTIVEVGSAQECNQLLYTGCFKFINSYVKNKIELGFMGQRIVYVLGTSDSQKSVKKRLEAMEKEKEHAFEAKIKECFGIKD